ncbi:citrate synthase, mitochondrial precursor, putative [Plasmodium knowlesi strain H]|uniref:Citrate synthase n=3 Tax=Plasmodium knowlesi TaxID=5850 RepID=A0A5K1UAX8_PLAKH|nr:citrate synthase, mitochondrial, putative [Plasmodium knowlesi strain H]OTN68339.1 Citrate synthase [Plasmodium knowlesi]CAA9987118.1 citrate synthase, mitochondrial, putative [Plasmodium knowlesi strain H]SBO23866.1 citrate synthase, mitochondrial precursor, putative [Plasmodium knowlesi strain H]SBO25684.1 citrate synthase, mitochondrial precursor, putative [Plasmodium knowlesi strain H]VVS76592.1 citrate synthase, mitochondrial, putative [Plasmodium knowlesi strain H]|eukprot:XP_002261740.1 citrate synthase, mitochondrial precursor,putative [Plasmodium knowlesi strain H]
MITIQGITSRYTRCSTCRDTVPMGRCRLETIFRRKWEKRKYHEKICMNNKERKVGNEKKGFFSCSNVQMTSAVRMKGVNTNTAMHFSSDSKNESNLYLDNYAKIKKYINSIDNDESVIMTILKEKTFDCIQKTREKLKAIMHTYPNTPISICTPNNVIGGLRNTITLITDTSILEKRKGILFRGRTVDKILKDFPKWDKNCEYPMAEAMLWYLLTKEIPAVDDLKLFSRELYCRAKKMPSFVFEFIDSIPTFTHPMSQLVSTVSFLESLSLFKIKYSEGILKKDYWKYILEDAVSLIAQIQVVGAYIFKRSFIDNNIKKGEGMNLDIDFDWSANFAKLIGFENKEVKDLLRLYFLLHSDHEGGNASAHVSHLIGSTLGNPYLCFSGCAIALSGPLHGLANQECLKFLLDIKKQLEGNELTYGFIEKYAKDFLNSGRVIPGYGHAVLRVPDPRFLALRNFALAHFPNDPIVQILEMCYKVIPGILSATGKVKNPYPNVDCYSGSLLHHYGIKYPEYYTVLFALSRAIGVMAQLVLSRGLMYPLERPKSVDVHNLRKICEKNYVKIEEFE